MEQPKDKVQAFNMLQDVITQFSKPKRRSFNNDIGKCLYNPPNPFESSGCAIGMYLSEKTCKALDRKRHNKIRLILEAPEAKLLPQWMKDMGEPFLSILQSLHDMVYYWEDKGLSEDGKVQIQSICSDFNLDYTKLKF